MRFPVCTNKADSDERCHLRKTSSLSQKGFSTRYRSTLADITESIGIVLMARLKISNALHYILMSIARM